MVPTPSLASEACTECRPGTPTLSPAEIAALLGDLADGWTTVNDLHLERRFSYRSFAPAFAAATRVALIAEAQQHHPDIRVGWGYLEIALTTHAAGGLTRNDFILAARIDTALAK